MSIDRTLQLRAQEIIMASPTAIAARDALKMALLERYTSLEEMAEAAASFSVSALNKLVKSTYNLPDTSQGSLFDVPSVIAIRTPDRGPVLIPRSEATVGQVRQWVKEGKQFHSTQRLRFERAAEDLEALEGVDEAALFVEARQALEAGDEQ